MTHGMGELIPARKPHWLRPVPVVLSATDHGTLHETDEERNAGGGLGSRRRASLLDIHSGSEPAGVAPEVDTEVGHGHGASWPLGANQARGLRDSEDHEFRRPDDGDPDLRH